MRMSRDEQLAAGIAMGIPRDKILSAIGITEPEPVRSGYSAVVGPRLDFPIRFTLPWSALCSENRRFCARGNRIFMTQEYKNARCGIVRKARAAMSVGETIFRPLALPLSLHARVWFPDNRIHDVANFCGATLNALKGIVFKDDVWVYDVRWERVATDVDAPRAEIEVRPL